MDILSKQLMRHTFQNYLGKVTKNNFWGVNSQSIANFICFSAKTYYLCSGNRSVLRIMTQQEIGIAIKQRRKKLKVNQQTLADLSGVAVNTIVAIERGVGNPHLQTILAVLDTLGLRVDLPLK